MNENTEPYEIIAAPLTLWMAPVGTAFPGLEEAPSGPWVKVGTSGDLNYAEEGVSVTHKQGVELWRALGDAGPRKAFRSQDELRIKITLADLSLEQYALALNNNTVTDVAPAEANPGWKQIGLSRGLSVAQRALLVRGDGVSPYYAGMSMQYEVPIAVQVGDAQPVYRKNEPAGLALEFVALIDPNAATTDERFGRLLAQDAEPGT